MNLALIEQLAETIRHPADDHRYITTYLGRKIKAPNLYPSQVDLTNIGCSLSMQVRFLGHLRKFYSVAEHSILVARIAEEFGEPPVGVRAAFAHDFHEAYSGDFPSPFKDAVPELRPFEGRMERAVHEALELPPKGHGTWARVRVYDVLALHYEAFMLSRQRPEWLDPRLLAHMPAGCYVDGWEWPEARRRFFRYAEKLGFTVDRTALEE